MIITILHKEIVHYLFMLFKALLIVLFIWLVWHTLAIYGDRRTAPGPKWQDLPVQDRPLQVEENYQVSDC